MIKPLIEQLRTKTCAPPTSPKFDLDSWKEALNNEQASPDEKNVLAIGLHINKSLDALRTHLGFVTSDTTSTYWRRRGLVALINHQSIVAEIQGAEAASQRESPRDGAALDRVVDVKIKLGLGEFSPDAIIESVIDAGGRLLRMIASEIAKDDATDVEPSFAAISKDLNIGVAYAILEGLWLDVVWNDFRMSGDVNCPQFASNKADREKQRAESNYRHLITTVQSGSIQFVRMRDAAVNSIRASVSLDLQATVSLGQLKLKPAPLTCDGMARRSVIQTSTLPEYFESVLNSPGPKFKRLTLTLVAQGYALLVSIAESASAHSVGVLDLAQSDPSSDVHMVDFAPALSRLDLRDALVMTMAVSNEVAEEMIAFFTGAGEAISESIDLWVAPLVSLTKTTLTLFPQAARHASQRRLADLWLRRLGFDLDIRGLPFEAHVRTTLHAKSLSSSLLPLTQVLSKEFVLNAAHSREEQIDLVIVLGDRVLIGEAKCFLQPSSPLDQRNHWEKLREAAAQVARKVSAVKNFESDFRICAQHYGLILPASIDILPVVILNHAIDVGNPVDGIPVVDLRILEMFFEGLLMRNAIVSSSGEIESTQLDRFYNSAAEAPAALSGYLYDPPQLRHLHRAVVPTEQTIFLPTTATNFARVQRHEVSTDRLSAPR